MLSILNLGVFEGTGNVRTPFVWYFEIQWPQRRAAVSEKIKSIEIASVVFWDYLTLSPISSELAFQFHCFQCLPVRALKRKKKSKL